MPNGLHHTVLPICWSLALKCTCGHPEACGRGGLSLLSTAHQWISNFSWGRWISPAFCVWLKTNIRVCCLAAIYKHKHTDDFFFFLIVNISHAFFFCPTLTAVSSLPALGRTVKGLLKQNYQTHKVKCQQLCTHFKWLFITLMDLLVVGILFLFSNESVQHSDGGHKEWHIYLQARWFDKDSHSELLQHTGWGLQWRLGFTVLYRSNNLLYYICMDRALIGKW